ncbi:MAG: NADH-quinone oxidoreductase subunit L, partial [Pseudomonas sp.]
MNALFLNFVFPLIGFLLLSFSRGRLGENLSALIGVGSVGLSAATSAWIIYQFNVAPPEAGVFTQQLWVWMSVEGFAPSFTLHLDGLSLTMLGVVTGVGFLIHLFASWYMRGEEGYSRFFAYTNLFIFSMLLLVLGDNLLLLYFGWEGVGLCSYLLIGFYYSNPNNGNAALKAFIVTRVGDVFMAFGLFILYMQLGTLNIQELLTLAPQKFAAGDPWLTLATLALLGGAVGKSAQLPLQTWLADAMAGPTPVSALIHAATMVTAGVYLIARINGLFLLFLDVRELVGVVGGVTLVLAG